MPTLVSSLQPLMLLFSFSFHLFCPTELKMNASPSLFNMEKPQCWLVCFFGFVLGFFFFCCFGGFFVISFLFAFSLVFCFVGGVVFFVFCFFLEEDLHSIRNISTFLKIGEDAVEALNRNTKFFFGT